jgi:hypothetical protein
VLIRLGRFSEARSALERAGDPSEDPYVRYWARLFRGAAADGLGDPSAAARAYTAALDLVPGAQSPAVALMALTFTHDEPDAAVLHAIHIRRGADVVDPWWEYGYGDRRFLETRLARLREMARR